METTSPVVALISSKDSFKYKVTLLPNFFYCFQGKYIWMEGVFLPLAFPSCPALWLSYRHSLSWPQLDFSVALRKGKVTLFSFSLALDILDLIHDTWYGWFFQRENSTFHLCEYGGVCPSLGTKQGCLNLLPASFLVYLEWLCGLWEPSEWPNRECQRQRVFMKGNDCFFCILTELLLQ